MSTKKQARSKIIRAFDDDFGNDNTKAIKKALKHIDKYSSYFGMIKLGMKNITKLGPEIVVLTKKYGIKIFYDMKFFDIPNTVKNAAYEATKLGVSIINVHALGGTKMMQAAKDGINQALSENKKLKRPKLIAVTILTSMSQEDLKEIGIYMKIETIVKRLAILAHYAGLDGVVCSPKEISILRSCKELPENFLLVTPGIRPEWASKDDQSRVMTPAEAIDVGSDYLVLGRPLQTIDGAKKTLKEVIKAL